MLGKKFMEISTQAERGHLCPCARVLCAAGYARADWKQEQERLPANCKYQVDKSTWKCGWLCIQIVSHWSCGMGKTRPARSKRDNAREKWTLTPKDRTLFHGNLIRFASRYLSKKFKRLTTNTHTHMRTNAGEVVAVARSVRNFRKKVEENALSLLQYLIFIGVRIGIPFAGSFFPCTATDAANFLVRSFAPLPFVGLYRCL